MISKIFLFLAWLFLLTACGGGGGSSSVQEGTKVEFSLQHFYRQNSDLSYQTLPAGQKTIVTNSGVEVTLDKAYITLWSIALEKNCRQFSWRSLVNFFVKESVAHAEENPQVMNVPHVINVLADDAKPFSLPSISPAVGDYCGVTVQLLKADDDAQGLPKDVNMINKLLYIEGSYRMKGQTESVPFVLSLSQAALPIYLNKTFSLSKSTPRQNLRLAFTYGQWFDNVDFINIDSIEQKK
jgi:hypothetical protein